MPFAVEACQTGKSTCFFPNYYCALYVVQQSTLRIITVGLFVLTGPLVPLLKRRLPPSERAAIGKTNLKALQKPLFWVYCTRNVAQGPGYLFPSLYPPSMQQPLGLLPLKTLSSSSFSAPLNSSVNLASGISPSIVYPSNHRVLLNLLILISTLVSGLATPVLWGLAKPLAALVMFALVYGFFRAWYKAIWARIGSAVQ
ncbi:hypothetical protein B0O99DRAFT_698977 [Bisporella sp. PMI_857]|nr:hypothetical protein B0O99DRAFT_698977 [Bisporella sp. PMI_857]